MMWSSESYAVNLIMDMFMIVARFVTGISVICTVFNLLSMELF